MNIIEAVATMRRGGWVARSIWKPTKMAIFHRPDAIDGDPCGVRNPDGNCGSIHGPFASATWPLSLDDLEATDWEEVEPT